MIVRDQNAVRYVQLPGAQGPLALVTQFSPVMAPGFLANPYSLSANGAVMLANSQEPVMLQGNGTVPLTVTPKMDSLPSLAEVEAGLERGMGATDGQFEAQGEPHNHMLAPQSQVNGGGQSELSNEQLSPLAEDFAYPAQTNLLMDLTGIEALDREEGQRNGLNLNPVDFVDLSSSNGELQLNSKINNRSATNNTFAEMIKEPYVMIRNRCDVFCFLSFGFGLILLSSYIS